MKEKSFLMIKCLTNVMFFCGIPVTISVPFVLRWYSRIDYFYEQYYILQTILFLVCGTLACLIVGELRKMIKTIEVDNCFVMENVTSMKKMGIYALVIAAACFIRLVLSPTPGAFSLIIVFVVAGLLSNVLSSVFHRAVEYKLENDLTI